MVDAADIAEVQRMAALAPEYDVDDLSALQSIPEVLGYIVACARAEDRDEAADVELVVRSVDMSPDAVRVAELILRPLGYVAVCDMLRKIAGRRKHELAPLQ
jgi:hypothetical protein